MKKLIPLVLLCTACSQLPSTPTTLTTDTIVADGKYTIGHKFYVYDRQTGQTLAGATVTVHHASGTDTGATGHNGMVMLDVGKRDTSDRVQVTLTGYAAFDAIVNVDGPSTWIGM